MFESFPNSPMALVVELQNWRSGDPGDGCSEFIRFSVPHLYSIWKESVEVC